MIVVFILFVYISFWIILDKNPMDYINYIDFNKLNLTNKIEGFKMSFDSKIFNSGL